MLVFFSFCADKEIPPPLKNGKLHNIKYNRKNTVNVSTLQHHVRQYCAFTETDQQLGPIVSGLGRNKEAERRPVDIDRAILK